jgi:hypothetical protein
MCTAEQVKKSPFKLRHMKNWEKSRTAPSGIRTRVRPRKFSAYLKPLHHSTHLYRIDAARERLTLTKMEM